MERLRRRNRKGEIIKLPYICPNLKKNKKLMLWGNYSLLNISVKEIVVIFIHILRHCFFQNLEVIGYLRIHFGL